MLAVALFIAGYLAAGVAMTFFVAREDRATGRPYVFDKTAIYAACILIFPASAACLTVVALVLLAGVSVAYPTAAFLRQLVESKPPVVDLPPEQVDAFFSELERERSADRPN